MTLWNRTILASALALAFTAPASAATFYDIDGLGGIRLSAGGASEWSDTFDVTSAGIEGDVFHVGFPYTLFPQQHTDAGGFVVGTHTAVEASFEIWVRDDFDLFRPERLVVDLGGVQTAGPIEVDFGVESVGLGATLLATIDETGRLDYTLVATRGDFRVDYVGLTVEALGDAAPPIPEVGSLSAYAVGTLLVAGFVRRRR